MKSFLRLAAAALLAVSALSARADDLEKLAGTWSAKKTGEDGQSYTQIVEIAKDRFKFKILGSNDQVVFFAEGGIKLEKLGPFNVAKFTGIKAGASETDTQPVAEERTSIYMLDDTAWTVASNFDEARDKQKPKVDTYTKAAK